MQYYEDSSLSFIGRKDTQVKIRGQRVELGEVERYMRECIPQTLQAKELIAEVVIPGGEVSSPLLAIFLSSANTEKAEIQVLAIPADVEEKLEDRLPNYMIPRVCFILPHLPMTSTDKVNRKRLREIGASYSAQQLADLRSQALGGKRMPSTEVEEKMQQLCSHVLNISLESVGMNNSFFWLRGDSIAAMKLVAEARNVDLQLSVANIFQHPRLSDLAALIFQPVSGNHLSSEYKPYSLISPEPATRILTYLRTILTSINPLTIEDILPTTAFQQSYLRVCVEQPLAALNYFSLDLGRDIDVQLLRHACAEILERFPILRTIFVPHISLKEQIVLRKLSPRLEVISVDVDLDIAAENVFIYDTQQGIQPGTPYVAFFLLSHKHLGHRLLLQISHAQYDGVCLPLIIQSLLDVYHNSKSARYPLFPQYLAYVQSQRPQAARYWRKLLEGSRITSLKQELHVRGPLVSGPELIRAECSIPAPDLPRYLTPATIASAAWALVLCSFTGQTDVVYGQLVTGRNGSMPGIQEVVGPCVNIVPVRAQLLPDQTTHELLNAIQDQILSRGQADSMSLQEIIGDCTNWPSETQFESIIQHIGSDRTASFRINDDCVYLGWLEQEKRYFPHMNIFSTSEDNKLKLDVTGDRSLLSPELATSLLNLFRAAVTYLSENPAQQLSQWLELKVDIGDRR